MRAEFTAYKTTKNFIVYKVSDGQDPAMAGALLYLPRTAAGLLARPSGQEYPETVTVAVGTGWEEA